eukprot:1235284-Prymnesium_polylepis.1
MAAARERLGDSGGRVHVKPCQCRMELLTKRAGIAIGRGDASDDGGDAEGMPERGALAAVAREHGEHNVVCSKSQVAGYDTGVVVALARDTDARLGAAGVNRALIPTVHRHGEQAHAQLVVPVMLEGDLRARRRLQTQ